MPNILKNLTAAGRAIPARLPDAFIASPLMVVISGVQDPHTAPESLVASLLSLLTNPATMDTTRSAAAAYLASFLARARFVPPGVIVDALGKLAAWCLAYCTARPAPPPSVGLGGTPGRADIRLRACHEAAGQEMVMRHQVPSPCPA